ncbi:unnamed protein product [Zymoseptoria tritici ST99CH_1E4]|uniref:DNA 3'-5' helicase n=1 Tax=Zymoseptoria tritici ST99CH_1E4 TaxID=1276532 RepID=A0A2H1G5Y7_ZYMTR|nr:unnamed protein product [Zymoseptoria tritici ST99CH_1E4]
MVEQLDQLQRGAREVRPRNDDDTYGGYGTLQYHNAETYDQRPQQYYENDASYHRQYDHAIGEQVDRQPAHDYQHDRESTEYARQPMQSGPQEHQHMDNSYHQSTYHEQSAPSQHNFSRFAFEPDRAPSSSSPRRLPSSPSFVASQRRPGASAYARHEPTRYRDIPPPSAQRSTYYEPTSQADDRQDELPEDIHHVAQPIPPPPQPNNMGKQKEANLGPPIVQGIQLISTRELPDRLRKIFPYPNFNAVQSKSFGVVYRTSDNFVLSSPTGSGKTAMLELAICRLVSTFTNGSYKIVYMAPTKSLCSERQRDWQAKFAHLDLQCAELTGDTENAQLRNVQHASIIITTPEKWDSMTRKWKDHQKLMQMVKLFLIDEVHILKEDRGASLEAVVSRMKSIGSDVRFVALSATVPNSQDIATWLGKDTMNPHIPASRERLGEEFRPVPLRKHVCGYNSPVNDFAFDKTLNAKLPDVIAKFSHRKPLMGSPLRRITVGDKDLQEMTTAGVAYHHAGLSLEDRLAVEKGYLAGEINVICCTSTLAVGVNLPCHMVVIKNTVTYQSSAVCKEYSDLEVMQMLGRAGRPQFDTNAVAVIMTRLSQVPVYEKMISGQEVLESCLHRNLIDHLNAEIGLGSITSVSTAKRWLSGTFLYVRLKENPEHYKIESDAPGRNLDERLENICSKAIELLKQTELVDGSTKLQCTEFGDAMARYYLQFQTMRTFLSLPPKAKISEILSALTQAAEFKDIRFRAGEKSVYKELNKNSSIKFPIPVNIDMTAHKISLVVQSVLGGIELPTEEGKHRIEYNTYKSIVFQHAHRLIRCIVDCQLHLNDSTSARHALMLARSLASQVWDDSPLSLKQLEGVGPMAVRKLVNNNIRSIEDLETTDSNRIEMILSRNPPFGSTLQNRARAFPKLRIAMKAMGEPIVKKGECVTLNIKAEIGFLNEQIPEMFQRKPVYVCVLIETSNGCKSYFARMSAKKLNRGQDLLFTADLTGASQVVRGYIMCDEIAGTQRTATLDPEIPAFMFPTPKRVEELNKQRDATSTVPNTTKLRAVSASQPRPADDKSDEFGDDTIDELDLTENDTFMNIDDFDDHGNAKSKSGKKGKPQPAPTATFKEPVRLENGKWACNHPCKEKDKCKHVCCKEGMDNKPKPPKSKESKKMDVNTDPRQTQLDISRTKKSTTSASLPQPATVSVRKSANSKEAENLNRLHDKTSTSIPTIPRLATDRSKNEAASYNFRNAQSSLNFPKPAPVLEEEDEFPDDFDLEDFDMDDLLFTSQVKGTTIKKNHTKMTHAKINDTKMTHAKINDTKMNDTETADFSDEDMLDFGLEDNDPSTNPDFDETMADADVASFPSDHGEDDVQKWSELGLEFHEDAQPDNELTASKALDRALLNSQAMQQARARGKDKDLFVTGESSSTASNQLSSSTVTRSSSSPEKHERAPNDLVAAGDFFHPAKRHKQSFEDDTTDAIDYTNAVPGNEFLAEVAAADEAKEQKNKDAPVDEAGEWFKQMFGTEMFEYIG